MSGEESSPITSACGNRSMSSSVELPGPQPRSNTRVASLSGTCAKRSREGRVRSSSNLRYWRADQSFMGSTRELHILDPVRDYRIRAQPTHLVLLVILVVALEPFHMALALEGKDVGRDAVKEPAIVADDHGAAGEVLQRLFQRAQRIDVEIVGRLVEQQHIGARLEHLGEMHAVSFAARELADLLLLVGALEVERRTIGTRVHLPLAQKNDVVAAGDFLPDVLLAVERVARLVDIAKVNGLADRDLALVGLLLAGDHPEQRGLAGTIGTDHAHDAA